MIQDDVRMNMDDKVVVPIRPHFTTIGRWFFGEGQESPEENISRIATALSL